RRGIGGHVIGHADGTVIAEPLAPHGIALGIGVNPWFGMTDPERMGQSVVDEAVRNVVACGGDPDQIALLDNFSWGDPRREETLGDLVATVAGACEAAIAFGAPFVSGKDSLNNEYLGADGGRHAVPPTLVITAVAHVPEASRTITPDLKAAGNALLVVGMTPVAFGGSHIALVRDIAPSSAPPFDQSAPARYRRLHAAIRDGLVVSCHDISEGGLAVALAEMAIAGNLGFDAPTPPPTFRADANDPLRGAAALEVLFGEGNGRFVVEVEQRHVAAFVARMSGDATVIGAVATGEIARFPVFGEDGMSIPVAALRQAWIGRP
ncbi:MAG: phosphoribosylformylglycinamidine synthase subunit PurL, partial [Proteobacteria bacterium]|nr:phosphoribosylformylglycinamidine synthase subunit PurL [Pseudomonadota bacterium]